MIDTRRKILTPAEAVECAGTWHAQGVPLQIVTGSFDVLRAALLRRLDAIAQPGAKLFAIVVDPPHPVLKSRARAELAASLRVLDYVVSWATDGTADVAPLVAALAPASVHSEEAFHLEATRRLIGHVAEVQHREQSR